MDLSLSGSKNVACISGTNAGATNAGAPSVTN